MTNSLFVCLNRVLDRLSFYSILWNIVVAVVVFCFVLKTKDVVVVFLMFISQYSND